MAKRAVKGFAAKLRDLRQAAGLNQVELADRVGVTKQSIGRLESGDSGPSWEMVMKLAAALGVSCEAFVDEPPAAKKKPARKAGK
jgi:transcriptional regulator with XRE-family HTH domain